jgi:predicted dehydrogenase
VDHSSPSFRVALVGYGFSGKTFHAPLISAVPGLDLVAVSSGDSSKVRRDLPDVTVHPDPFDLVTASAIDLVVIATPNDSHAPLARAALLAGKHVVVDKPFTLDMSEARELITLAARQDRILSVFHNRRWDSDFLTVQRAIADGLAGNVSHFESHFDRFRPLVRDRWRERAGPGSGVWFDLGPHLVDHQALRLFGLPDRVQANLARQRDGSATDDWAHIILDYGERRIILHASMLVARRMHRFTVHGDAGSLVKRECDQQEQQLLAGMRPGASGWGEDGDQLLVYDGDGKERLVPATAGDQRLYYAGIAAALRGTAKNPVPGIQALATMAVIEAAIESARTNSTTKLPLTVLERDTWGRSEERSGPTLP